MRLTVIGCGHLGATHAACMAEIGHDVVGLDIDEAKVRLLNSGKAWFREPGLDEMLSRNVSAGRLRFTESFTEAAAFAAVHFLAVATPGLPDGSYDLSQLRAVMSSLLPRLPGASLIIGKSTVPPGTAAMLQAMADSHLSRAEVAWNPEFLREGHSVEDTLRPDRIVAGVAGSAAEAKVREIYAPLTEVGVPLVVTDLVTSELVKGVANAFLATKISFINAMADMCSAAGGDVSVLARALGMDPRIGRPFLTAGIGYGGACLPKDVRGLAACAARLGARDATDLLAVVDAINVGRRRQVVDLVRDAAGRIKGKRIAVWGAAFKPGTDDVRGSPGLDVADSLHSQGANVTVYDPMATGNALESFAHLAYADSALHAVTGADVLVIVTAWPEFADISPSRAGRLTARPVLVDACQAVDPEAWRDAGWAVAGVHARRSERSGGLADAPGGTASWQGPAS
ncbi:MAG: UDP-glucose/GDP-mannose dehydrogenase family protein [Actinobacteria bacterium]|nr:UDP-glucose/GDP-mannose dehydrogenase family protein [Actinomycetota bacterium]